MTYRVLTHSRRIEKAFLRIITGLSEEEQSTIWHILRTHPKGSGETHWTMKKVARDIWQLDLPSGYRLAYTVVDTDRVVLVLFIGNHDDAAAYLRGKK
jgi:mRNA-degrading endonuclease RelE of RelBE toxin-antitoxin system